MARSYNVHGRFEPTLFACPIQTLTTARARLTEYCVTPEPTIIRECVPPGRTHRRTKDRNLQRSSFMFAWLCWIVISKMTDEDSKSQVGVILLKNYSQILRWVKFIREGHVILWPQLLLPNRYRTLRDINLHHYSCFHLIL